MELEEKTLEEKVVFRGRILTVRSDRVLLPNGAAATREVVDHPGGVCVLALQGDGTVPLVRQFRYPVGRVMLELPAGKLERGEEPLPAAVRELGEEVGLVPGEMTGLGAYYTSPGFSRERLYLYLARGLRAVPAHPDEDEFLDVVRLPFAALADKVMSGEIMDGKTVIATLKVKALLGL